MFVQVRNRLGVVAVQIARLIANAAAAVLCMWGLAAAADRFLSLRAGMQDGYFPQGLNATAGAVLMALVLWPLEGLLRDKDREEADLYRPGWMRRRRRS